MTNENKPPPHPARQTPNRTIRDDSIGREFNYAHTRNANPLPTHYHRFKTGQLMRASKSIAAVNKALPEFLESIIDFGGNHDCNAMIRALQQEDPWATTITMATILEHLKAQPGENSFNTLFCAPETPDNLRINGLLVPLHEFADKLRKNEPFVKSDLSFIEEIPSALDAVIEVQQERIEFAKSEDKKEEITASIGVLEHFKDRFHEKIISAIHQKQGRDLS